MVPDPDTLTVEELVEAANARLEALADTFRVPPEPFSARTVYYYTQHGILPRIRGVRKAERYPADWVHRLLFVRRLQQELPRGIRESLTELVGEDPSMLSGIAKVLEALSDSRIRAIALGEEPVQILPASFGGAERDSMMAVREPSISFHRYARPSEAAMSPSKHRVSSEPPADYYSADAPPGPRWVQVHGGELLKLRVREDALDPETRQELEVAARLMERALAPKPDPEK